MIAYELLAKLRILTLSGQDEYGELEWIGTRSQWNALEMMEENIVANYAVNNF